MQCFMILVLSIIMYVYTYGTNRTIPNEVEKHSLWLLIWDGKIRYLQVPSHMTFLIICGIFQHTSGSIVGAFAFLYASQPYPGETTYSYPCTYPSDFNSDGTCKQINDCPRGRVAPNNTLGAICSICIPNIKRGCYPFGIGVQGSIHNT